MKVDQKGNTSIIRNTQGDCVVFLDKVTSQYATFKDQNIILNMSDVKDITLKDLKLFTELSKIHKKAKKSFVIVVDSIDFNAVPEKLTVVPSLLEAHDIIDMEEIERDLGF